jgi:hypothetical protein
MKRVPRVSVSGGGPHKRIRVLRLERVDFHAEKERGGKPDVPVPGRARGRVLTRLEAMLDLPNRFHNQYSFASTA